LILVGAIHGGTGCMNTIGKLTVLLTSNLFICYCYFKTKNHLQRYMIR
jgi:hypothetical protein